jgi:tetratricopeptide (TPR) repeat protein
LDIDPAYQPALQVRSEIEASLSSSKSKEDQDKEIKGWVDSANALIAANRPAEAKSEYDKIERLRPGAPELQALRKKLTTKSADAERSQKEQLQSAQKQKTVNELSRKAEDLFHQGKYAEAQTVAEQWMAETPQNSQAQNLHNQINEALSSLKTYEASIAAKSYDAALAAVQHLERINSSDPGIAELRKRAESSKAAAKASFSILRLGEPGALTLDDQHIGTGGEIENKSVSVGRHKLAVRGSSGKQGSAEIEFVDGQNLTFVYDTAANELRPMAGSDNEAIARRKQREEVHDFAVEHQHGLFKGKCAGTLTISGLRVEYKPSEGDHSFAIPFQNLKLALKEGKLEFTAKPDDRQYQFKTADAKQANTIKKLWDTLEKLAKP